MTPLSYLLLISIAFSVFVILVFVLRAWRTGNWSRPADMLSEFVAVFAAIAIGIWINAQERSLDRDEARIEREQERREDAQALLSASIEFTEGMIEPLLNDQLSVARVLLFRPNVVETFIANSNAIRFYTNDMSDVVGRYQQFAVRDSTVAEDCRADPQMYFEQQIDGQSDQTADRWISHAGDYAINLPDNLAEKSLIPILTEINLCVTNGLRSQTLLALDLYEALCIASLRASNVADCDWTLVSSDIVSRDKHNELRSANRFDFASYRIERFKSGLNTNVVLQRYLEHTDALNDRFEAATGG